MIEEVLVTARSNAKIDPVLDIWHWEIPVYLFLGGLTAGIMFFAAWVILTRRDEQAPYAAMKLALWAPIVLSIGMGALFLDLEHKLYVWRFYTTFQTSSPMSWGSWILLIIYPIAILQILSTLRQGYPMLADLLARIPFGTWAMDFSEKHRTGIARAAIPFAVSLAIYTGILLSAFSARPFWNTGILGPLFLISGLSSAAALAILISRAPSEKHLFTRIDVGLILVELMLIALLVINLTTGTEFHLRAADHILGGNYTVVFWVYFVGLGLLIPLLLEFREMR
ncbi:MAG: NrfD/PsrC family molybdoenzyme membrane anchor subunit, partial [Pseudomonadota bacterium]|nr:NrfD/PsrC family molybdoenzyme membrane anchor subunit [Pseudomonadota bacterium]